MSGTVIAPHPCASVFQDNVYGTGMRVFNIGKQDCACTVCGGKRPLPAAVKESKGRGQ